MTFPPARSTALSRRRLLGALGAGSLAPALSGCRERTESGITLRMVSTNHGERMREPFAAALREFEREHPGVRVRETTMDDDVYQKMGLVNLFVGGDPPDLFFQWGGELVRKYADAGHALDLTPFLPPEERERFLPSCWASCRASGGYYLWPTSASVTTVLWYRRSLFERAVQPPTTWEELIAVCESFRQSGTIPIAVGNKELWSGGNFAAWIAAQRLGAERYRQVLGLAPGTRLDDPELVDAFRLLSDLQARGFFNRGVAGVSTDEARSLLAQGRAAMHPIGDWLVSEVEPEEAEDLDAILLPPLPNQSGETGTLLALATGYMVARRSRHPELAVALLRHLTRTEVQRGWTEHGHVSSLRAAAPGPEAPVGQRRLTEFMETAPAAALAPDVGFNLEVSDAFLDAVSLVLAGRAAPETALADAERQVRALRRAAA
ncbi:MAG: ABC transporter substrate-binding protein [Armatimonadota bacterium]